MTLPTPLFRVEVRGDRGDVARLSLATTRLLGVIPRELHEANVDGAEMIRDQARLTAKGLGAQPAIIPIRVTRSIPIVWAGGNARIGRKRKPAYKLVFGAEFGARVLKQYRPWVGARGYFLFPAIIDTEPERTRRYSAALSAVSRAWSRA